LSKQSNQRYRKEKERELAKKANDSISSNVNNSSDKDKLNYREFNAADKTEK
jgi:hypothetical protein